MPGPRCAIEMISGSPISWARAEARALNHRALIDIFDGFTQQGCVPPARAIAPLSMQTSLTPATCGPILVVQARPG